MRLVFISTNAGRRAAPGTGLLLAAAATLAPAGIFALLVMFPAFDPSLGAPGSHSVIVTTISALALVLTVAVFRAARRLPDARTLFLALGFASMATIFFAHGLGTAPFMTHAGPPAPPVVTFQVAEYGASGAAPTYLEHPDEYGATVQSAAAPTGGAHAGHAGAAPTPLGLARLRVVGYSAQLSLLFSAIFFALATVTLPARLADFATRHWTPLALAAFVPPFTHVLLALFFPDLLKFVPVESERFQWGVAIVAIGGLAFAAKRFYESYRLALLPLQGTMAVSMVLLIEAQWIMLQGELWQMSWWIYHVAMLAGFLAPVLALLAQYRRTGDLGAIVEGLFLRHQIREIRDGDPQALAALAAAVAAKDGDTGQHIERVAALAAAIGAHMGIEGRELEVLRWGARLHDLGKIGVPDRILKKPGKLTPDEFEEIKLHTVRGGAIARRSPHLAEAAEIIEGHHERWDGTGYPQGLRGEAIPLGARIAAAADVWDALASARPYKAAMPRDEVVAFMERGSGSHFDPACVDALFAVLGVEAAPAVPLRAAA